MKYYTKVRSMGWFYPMYSIVVDGKTYWQSPAKMTEQRIHDLKHGHAKPITFVWDNRRWFK